MDSKRQASKKTGKIPAIWPGFSCIQLGKGRSRRLLIFQNPCDILSTGNASEIPEILDLIENKTDNGFYATGYIDYEASSGLDPALPSLTRENDQAPLLWFGIYEAPTVMRQPAPLELSSSTLDWQPSLPKEDYLKAVDTIRNYIANGDCYQANFTFTLHADLGADVWPLFLQLLHSQQCGYGALIHTGQKTLLSASPELFYQRRGNRIVCRPMKGTLARKPSTVQDQQQIHSLHMSEKDRAENLMIVDMIRNDLGKIATSGSVKTGPLFEVERYPTVHQMVSHVECESTATLCDTLTALFPCASVTGAPKKRSMEILCELEKGPRHSYTGSIGFMAPGKRQRFNVAIRTLEIDAGEQNARYGTGSGIVWDSVSGREYEECITKTRVLTANLPEFELLETMLCENGKIFLLDLHCERMKNSADYFGFLINSSTIQNHLVETARGTQARSRFRARLTQTGNLHLDITPEPRVEQPPWLVRIATVPIDTSNPFYSHKTTHRDIYNKELKAVPEADDVILYDEQGHLTESCYGNIVCRFGDQHLTPRERPGFLPGVYRKHLLEKGDIQEATLSLSDLEKSDEVYLINSVRKKVPVLSTGVGEKEKSASF